MLTFDSIGYWSEMKIDIVRAYAQEYARIMKAQKQRFHFVYIDAFAGAGQHISRTSGQIVPGSPITVLEISPAFSEYHFIELEPAKAAHLELLIDQREKVFIHTDDCNRVLVEEVFPSIRYEDYRRGLCLLDPYALDLEWNVIATAGQLRTIEIFLNFPVLDMNRNVFWKNPEGVDSRDIARMNRFWGDETWRNVAYKIEDGLFGPIIEKEDNETIAEAFRSRLRDIGGFQFVPQPIPMRNSNGATVYYLFFASPNETAEKIVNHIFQKYRTKGL